jgi:hypothetical protein
MPRRTHSNQERMLGKLLKKYPRKSGEQIARMINAHIADLSDGQLAKIMGPVMVGRAGKNARKPARGAVPPPSQSAASAVAT